MPLDLGTLGAGDRLTRLETQRDRQGHECTSRHSALAEVIADMRVDLARQSTRVAVIVGGLAVVGTALVQLAFRFVP